MTSFTVFKRQDLTRPLPGIVYDTTQHLPLNFDTTQDAIPSAPVLVLGGRRYVVLAYAEVQRRLVMRQ